MKTFRMLGLWWKARKLKKYWRSLKKQKNFEAEWKAAIMGQQGSRYIIPPLEKEKP